MLQSLLKSQTRTSILTYLYTHPQQDGVHLRGLSRATKEHVYGIQREIRNLKKIGIIVVRKKFNKKIIDLNREHPFYYDLQRLVLKSTGLGYIIIKNQKKLAGITYAILTDNYIQKERHTKFDIDLMLVGSPSLDLVNSIMQGAEQTLNRDILYTVISEKDFTVRKSQQDTFITNVLDNNYIVLIGDELELAH